LRNWRVVQNREREFFGADYQPGDFVFTFQNGRPPHPDTIRQRFDRLAAPALSRDHLVESVRGAVPVLLRARFPGPLAAPGVRVSTHRALHGSCRQAGLGIGQGVGILLPR
jgi:hypothetical protein